MLYALCYGSDDMSPTASPLRTASRALSRAASPTGQWVRVERAYVLLYAARGGHLEVLQWARANRCPWDWATCAFAAEGGHLEVLQWARANGCKWDAQTCSRAARGGHLEMLQWARANGCEWDRDHVLSSLEEYEPPGHAVLRAWVMEQQ